MPEDVLKLVSIQVLQALHEYHCKYGKAFQGLDPSIVCFDQEGNQKLRFPRLQAQNPTRENIEKIKNLFITRQRIKSPIVSKNTPFSTNVKKEDHIFSDDIFEVGLLILQAATGTLNILNP